MSDELKVPRTPNPGSNAAIKLGCNCPVHDNNYGLHAPSPPDGWWNSGKCLIHPIKRNDDGDS